MGPTETTDMQPRKSTLLVGLAVVAGLFTVILIGLLVENVIFRTVEARTVRRWGMQSG